LLIFFVNRLVEQLCDVLIFNHDPPRCVGCEVRYLATFLVLIYPSTEKSFYFNFENLNQSL